MRTSAFIAHPNYPHSSSEADFPHLSRSLASFGIHVTQDLDTARILISMNHSPSHLRTFRKYEKSDKLKVLVRLEPRATYPVQYEDRTTKWYDLVITPGSLRDETKRIMWPYFYQPNPLRPNHSAPSLSALPATSLVSSDRELWDSRPYLLTLIASNKVSPTRHSNYHLRRSAVKELSNRGLRTFGEMWDASFPEKLGERAKIAWGATKSGYFPNPFSLAEGLLTHFPEVDGQVKNKHSIIQQSKYSLVIENDNLYVSEKIIDALVGGSLPFYVGGNLGRVGISSEVARRVTDFDQVIETINRLTPRQIQNWRENAYRLVSSPQFINSWSGERVYEAISRLIFQIIYDDSRLREEL